MTLDDNNTSDNNADEQIPVVDEDIVIEISDDEMKVSASLLPPEGGGEAITLMAAKKKLADAGVTYGVDEIALIGLVETKTYNLPRVVAEGAPAEDGEDGKLIFHFSTDDRTGRPREIGGGRVDYRSLDLYVPVLEGQLLVSRELATQGQSGISVKGKEIKQKSGKDAVFPRGKNVDINAEKTQMHSRFAGMVQLQGSSVNVSNVYNIKGDCDLSVGNIDFDGSVHITGGVRSGNTVKATGSIVVGGVVEAATIIAGGNVEVKSGMQGAGKGRIEAGGSVTALYVERGHVSADGPITVDVSIHSVLETGNSITAKGKRGAIIGGRAGAAGDITANYLGAISNTRTEIAVGMMIRKRERIVFLEKAIEDCRQELVKLNQLDVYLDRAKDKMEVEQWKSLHDSGVQTRTQCNENLESFTEEVGELKQELERATDGKVHVLNTVFVGTHISVGSVSYKVEDEISYATFKYRDGQIVYEACEISRSK